MPTWPSPRSERLGTPKIPAIRFTRGTYFGASRFTYATACQVARPPLTDRTRSPRPQRAFTSRLPAVWSPSLPLDITTTWTGLLLLAGLAPARMAASLAAPDPSCSARRRSGRRDNTGRRSWRAYLKRAKPAGGRLQRTARGHPTHAARYRRGPAECLTDGRCALPAGRSLNDGYGAQAVIDTRSEHCLRHGAAACKCV